jgi:hypothetical protein
VDQRLRCAEVCRAWRAVLSDRSLWLRLDLRRASGLARAATHEMLLAAVSRSGGQLQALDLSALDIRMDALMAVLHANAGTLIEISTFLTELDAAYHTRLPEIEALLRAAPLLQTVRMDVACGSCAQARPLLRREGLFRPLRVHQLAVYAGELDAVGAVDEAATLALADDVAEHDTLTQLWLNDVRLRGGALDALVTAALTRSLAGLHFWGCGLAAASVPALARLLGGGTLRALAVGDVVTHPPLCAPTQPWSRLRWPVSACGTTPLLRRRCWPR